MTYQGEGVHQPANDSGAHRERGQSAAGYHPGHDRRCRLYCLLGFAVASILAWLFVVLFARHTAIEIVLLIMICAGIGGAIFVASTGLCGRFLANRNDWGK